MITDGHIRQKSEGEYGDVSIVRLFFASNFLQKVLAKNSLRDIHQHDCGILRVFDNGISFCRSELYNFLLTDGLTRHQST